ncbi:MAG: deoxyhypusine synthase family protein, partial [Euryarchaeota archaeon]|nr:deoxyhypusine synthase family protein [Euryarchaeota archaeon]
MNLREFVDENFHHFNAGELARCSRSLEGFLESGGKLMVTLAGALSTAQIGRTLAPAIRAGFVSAISCTGANLEEDLFRLIAGEKYESVDWRNLTEEGDLALGKKGMNRVTDTCIPESEAVREIEKLLVPKWCAADLSEQTKPAHEYLFDIFDDFDFEEGDPTLSRSWLLAAKECSIPIYTPGWADSTLGNIFAARVVDGKISNSNIIANDVERMVALAQWYRTQDSPVGFLQVGGGIAGDFPICVVPMLRQDLGGDAP